MGSQGKAVFLDRDGTINVEKNYVYRKEDFEFLPGAIEGLRMLQEAGFKLVVISNQSGIARGYYTERDADGLMKWMRRLLRDEGVELDGVYYCPHHPDAVIEQYRMKCECRKPGTGLFQKAVRDFGLDLNASYAVGDKIRDCAICRESGCHGFLIGRNEEPEIIRKVCEGRVKNIQYAENLLKCARKICVEPLHGGSESK